MQSVQYRLDYEAIKAYFPHHRKEVVIKIIAFVYCFFNVSDGQYRRLQELFG